MDFHFIPQAEAELADAVAYYESQRSRLGQEFLGELSKALSLIQAIPEASPLISARTRRRRVRRFPYGLIYQIRSKRIAILAVMHLRRKPDYWGGRE